MARRLLVEAWQRIKNIKYVEDEAVQANVSVDEVENYFLDKGQPMISTDVSNAPSDKPNYGFTEIDFKNMLEEYETDLPRLHHKHSILKYWSGQLEQSIKIKNMPELREVAYTLLAIPSSQASCERNFSHMGFVFNKLRSLLAPKMLEDLLLIRTNRQLFSRVKTDERVNLEPIEYISIQP